MDAVLFQKWIGQQLHTCVWDKVSLPNALFHIFGTSEHAIIRAASFIVGGVTTEILYQLLVFKKDVCAKEQLIKIVLLHFPTSHLKGVARKKII